MGTPMDMMKDIKIIKAQEKYNIMNKGDKMDDTKTYIGSEMIRSDYLSDRADISIEV